MPLSLRLSPPITADTYFTPEWNQEKRVKRLSQGPNVNALITVLPTQDISLYS